MPVEFFKRKYIILYLCLILICLLIISRQVINEHFDNSDGTFIPKHIISTYVDKSKIPDKVYENIKTFAPNYKHIIFDDKEIISFLKTYYSDDIVKTFHKLKKGAHKADLFRYCYLYIRGGIYIDIKTELIQNINTIFNKKNVHLYTVYSDFGDIPTHIYQGIIASVPKNPIFLHLIEFIVQNKNPSTYDDFCIDFYNKLKSKFNDVTIGYNNDNINNYNVYLFNEECNNNDKKCPDGLDRYGLCCHITDNNTKIIKTRYSDYPW